MHATTECSHLHRVTISLAETEQYVLPSDYKGGKPVLVSRVSVGVAAGEEPARVTVGGWYAKKDGTASAVRATYPPRQAMADLPEQVQAAVIEALGKVTCCG